jgi:hypothetical protein
MLIASFSAVHCGALLSVIGAVHARDREPDGLVTSTTPLTARAREHEWQHACDACHCQRLRHRHVRLGLAWYQHSVSLQADTFTCCQKDFLASAKHASASHGYKLRQTSCDDLNEPPARGSALSGGCNGAQGLTCSICKAEAAASSEIFSWDSHCDKTAQLRIEVEVEPCALRAMISAKRFGGWRHQHVQPEVTTLIRSHCSSHTNTRCLCTMSDSRASAIERCGWTRMWTSAQDGCTIRIAECTPWLMTVPNSAGCRPL